MNKTHLLPISLIMGIVLFLSAITWVTAERPEVFTVELGEEGRTHVNNHPPMDEQGNPEVNAKLMASWEKGLQVLSNYYTEYELLNYELIPSSDTDIRFTNYVTTEEYYTFSGALFHEERRHNMEKGDLFPAVLLNKERTHGILFWEKYNGNFLVIELHAKVVKDGIREWDVPFAAKEI